MCDFMDRYIKESRAEGIAEGKIRATIKTAKKFSIADDAIIKTLMEESNLSETDAKKELQNYLIH